MSEPVVEDLINITFSPTDNATIGLHKNPHQLYQNCNLGHDFNIDLNKTFDLNKCNEHIKASGEIRTVLDPFKKYAVDCTNQEKKTTELPQRQSLDRLESDDSLGILPDLLKDEMTSDLFKTELGFSDNETLDDISPELNESPVSFVFSPPSDKQFNRISLFLKNISTPLPNFGNDRRCSSTPKISVASQFLTNAADIEHYSSPHFLPDEKEEPIAGSCHIKFETDFNLDDLKNVKPLTSTYKTFSPPRLPSVLYELDEETDLKSEVNFKKHETFENNLNVTQTFSLVGDLHPIQHEDSIQAVNILNNTFQIKQPVFVESPDAVKSLKCSFPSNVRTRQPELNNCSEKEKVKRLNSTFAIPKDDTSFNVDCEKTFLIDFNSPVVTEVSSKSFYKDKMLNETHVLDMDSSVFSSKQQEQIGNVTFIKDLENDTQSSLENCYSSHSSEFKPMTKILEETFSKNNLNPILEETFSENDLNEMLDHSKKVLQCVNSKSQSVSHEECNIKANVTFSEKVEIFTGTKVSQNDNYLQEPASYYSPKALENDTFDEARKKNCFHDQINLAESENNSSNELSFSVALQSKRDATFSQGINIKDDQEIGKFHESDSTENINSITEYVSPKSRKTLASTLFNKDARGKNRDHDQINLNENDLSNKMLLSSALQSTRNTTFSEEINETVDQNINKLYKNNSNKNISSIIKLASPKALANATFNEEVAGKISLHNQINCAENEYNPANKMSHSDPSQSITDTIFYETNKKSGIVNGKFCGRDSIQVKSSSELVSSLLPKISKSLTFSEGSDVANILETSVFKDSNLDEKGEPNSQTIFSRNTACSLNLNESDNLHARINLPKAIEEIIFTGNASEETEFCTHSNSEEDCPFGILPTTSHLETITAFLEKTDQVQGDMDSILNENDQVQLSQNSLKEITSATFSEKTGEVQIEQISIPTENNEFDTSPNSRKEINAPFSGLADKDMKVQPEIQISQSDRDSLDETASSKFCLKSSFSRKATGSSVKNSLLESKMVVKKGLIKPTKIVYPRKVSEQCNGQLAITKPFCKPIIDKRSSTSDFNRSLNLSDNFTDKSNSKNFNRRLTLSCSSESDTYKSKCKTDFKKPFGIPSKLGLKRPKSNFQQSRLDTKFSKGDLKDINSLNDKQNLPSQPDSISCKDPKIVKPVAVASVNAKGSFSSKLRLQGKLPLKSLKMKECGLKSNAALANAAEKSNKDDISCSKVIDQPRKEIPEIEINNADSGQYHARHSIATNSPRKFLPFNNIPNKTSNSKPTVIKQKSAPASNSYKPDSLKPPSCMKLPNSIAKLKFSSLPKVQSPVKFSSNRGESKSGVNKRPDSGNQNSNGFLKKPHVPEVETVQFVGTQSTGHVKQKDNTRDETRPTTSTFPSREQTVLPSNSSNVKKSNGQCKFLPIPKVLRGHKSVNSNDVETSQQSKQNQVYQQTSGKLPQLRRIPAPRNK